MRRMEKTLCTIRPSATEKDFRVSERISPRDLGPGANNEFLKNTAIPEKETNNCPL